MGHNQCPLESPHTAIYQLFHIRNKHFLLFSEDLDGTLNKNGLPVLRKTHCLSPCRPKEFKAVLSDSCGILVYSVENG